MRRLSTFPKQGFPDDIPGLYARYVADYSSIPSGGTAGTVRDVSGNGRTMVRKGGTVTYESNAVNGRGVIRLGTNGCVACQNFINSRFVNGGCLTGVWKMNGAGVEPFWDTSTSLWCKAGTLTPQGWNVSSYSPAIINLDPVSPNGYHAFVIFWEPLSGTPAYTTDNATRQAILNFRDGASANGLAVSVAGRALEIPRDPASSGTQGIEFAELCFYDRRPKWTELFRINKYFAERYATPSVDDLTGFVGYLGNSTMQSMPHYSAPDLASRNAAIFNFAFSSGGIINMNSSRPEILEVVNYFRSRGKKVVIFCHHGHNNDYGSSTSSASNTIVRHFNGADGSTLFADIRATGAKLLIATSSPWCGFTSLVNTKSATVETYRAALNSWINASAVSGGYADAVYDLGATAEFGVFGEGASPTGGSSPGDYPLLWADNVHKTAAGEAAQAALIAASIQSLYDAA